MNMTSTFVRIFLAGTAVGFGVGIASARKIKEMMPKIIALAANQYVKDRWNTVRGRVSSGSHALANKAGQLKGKVSTGTNKIGKNISGGASKLKKSSSSLTKMLPHQSKSEEQAG